MRSHRLNTETTPPGSSGRERSVAQKNCYLWEILKQGSTYETDIHRFPRVIRCLDYEIVTGSGFSIQGLVEKDFTALSIRGRKLKIGVRASRNGSEELSQQI